MCLGNRPVSLDRESKEKAEGGEEGQSSAADHQEGLSLPLRTTASMEGAEQRRDMK